MDSEYYDQVVKPLRRAAGPSIFYLCFTLARQRRTAPPLMQPWGRPSTLDVTLTFAITRPLVNVRFCQVRDVRFCEVRLAINFKFFQVRAAALQVVPKAYPALHASSG